MLGRVDGQVSLAGAFEPRATRAAGGQCGADDRGPGAKCSPAIEFCRLHDAHPAGQNLGSG